MAAIITSDQVWREVEKQIFAVLAFVNPQGKPRTAGIVYTVRDRRLYVATGRQTWKARHISVNPGVSVTVTIAKRVPFMPWLPIPPATITFQGNATLHGVEEVPSDILRSLLRGLKVDEKMRESIAIIRITPMGDFLTYGVGVPLMTMRKPEEAVGRAPTGNSA